MQTSITQPTYQDKMDSVLKMLETGIRDVFTSDRYMKYLTLMSKFHNYSFNNVMLILMQRPDSTHVAGLHTWNTVFGRFVNKGETGIKILAPYSVKKEMWSDVKDPSGQVVHDPVTGKVIQAKQEVQIQAFRIVYVFDVSQTHGKPLPELVSELKSHLQDSDLLEKAIRDIADCPIEIGKISHHAKGYYDPTNHKIMIREGMASSQTVKTMMHELAHSRLHRRDSIAAGNKDRATMEVEAESIAYVVMQHLGVDVSEYSFWYLASWSESQELKELSSSLSLIQQESSKLIKLITERMTV